MKNKTNAMRRLDAAKIAYEVMEYEVDEKRRMLILTLGGNEELTREFPLQKGSIVFSLPIASQMLVMKFTQK